VKQAPAGVSNGNVLFGRIRRIIVLRFVLPLQAAKLALLAGDPFGHGADQAHLLSVDAVSPIIGVGHKESLPQSWFECDEQ
jgi:hypothetical protein